MHSLVPRLIKAVWVWDEAKEFSNTNQYPWYYSNSSGHVTGTSETISHYFYIILLQSSKVKETDFSTHLYSTVDKPKKLPHSD